MQDSQAPHWAEEILRKRRDTKRRRNLGDIRTVSRNKTFKNRNSESERRENW